MPKFLFPTTISRHDARLSSTTHCALRASRINYNLANLSRCNSFLQYFSNMDLCSSLPSSPFLFQLFPMLSSDSPGTLSLSLPKSPSFLVTLQALVAKVTTTISLSLSSDSPGSLSLSLSFLPKSLNLLHNKTANLTYNTTQYVAAQSLSPIFLTLATTARNPIAYIYQIYHTAMGHNVYTSISTLQCPVVSA